MPPLPPVAAARFAIGLLFILLLLSPLPFGSVPSWAVVLIEISAAIVGAVAVWTFLVERTTLSSTGRTVVTIGSSVVLIGLLQLIPLPRSVVGLLASPTLAAREGIAQVIGAPIGSWMPLSLSPPATVDAALRWFAYLSIGFAAAVFIRTERRLLFGAGLIAAAGTFQGLYGSAEYLSGHQHIFWYPKKYFIDEASGTFVNRNHFAAFLSMCLPIAAALAVDGYRRLEQRAGGRRVFTWLDDRNGAWVLLAGVATASIWIGIVLSFSRGGLAAALASMALLTFGLAKRRGAAIGLVILLVIPTLVLLGMEVRAPGARILSNAEDFRDFGGRLPVWSATAEIVPNYPALGSGLGTFQPAFELYRHPETQKVWRHAHSDWLESAAEGGPALPLLLLALLFVLARSVRRSPTAVRMGLLASLAAISLQSLVDFGLRIPAIAVLSAFVVGCLAARDLATPPAVWNYRPRPVTLEENGS